MADDDGRSFWRNLAAILGALAALVTALVTLIQVMDDGDSGGTETGGQTSLGGGGGGQSSSTETTGGGGGTETTGGGGGGGGEGCVITVDHLGADIKTEPRHDARTVSDVPDGSYPALDWTTANWAGLEELWFLIEVEGRQGWIVYDTILISDKSAECP